MPSAIVREGTSRSFGTLIAIVKIRESLSCKGFVNFGIDSFMTFDPLVVHQGNFASWQAGGAGGEKVLLSNSSLPLLDLHRKIVLVNH
jgi:hypothetical protein